MSSETPTYGAALPPGKTCGDCRHFTRCAWLISCLASNTACDWAPSRFKEVTP